MITLSRWLAPAVLAAGFGFGAMAPASALAQDGTMTRVLVDVADVVLRGGQPYYRYGNYRDNDRLVVGRDRYGRPVYYRLVRVQGGYDDYDGYNNGYNNGYYNRYGYGYYNPASTARTVKCNKHGNCTVKYYDPQYDRRGYQSRYRDNHRGRGHDRGDHDDD